MSLAEHHRRKAARLHIQRFSWFTFMISGLFIVQLVVNMQPAGAQDVLAYATDINRADLLRLHNQNRQQAGLNILAGNASLDAAAQAKAEHMITNNYWAHVAPDGTTPWSFFDRFGYQYSNAGENLAYGFQTTDGVMTGWMNSAGHRANILGNYSEVGFGIASGPNYQGGENTVVVAFLATPQQPVVPVTPPAPVPAATTPQPPAKTAPPGQAAVTLPAPVSTTVPTPLAQPSAQPASPPSAPVSKPAPTLQAPQEERRIQSVQAALIAKEAWPLYASTAIIVISSIGFGVTHWRLLRLNWNRGARFAIAHPLTDTAAVAGAALLVFSATIGTVR